MLLREECYPHAGFYPDIFLATTVTTKHSWRNRLGHTKTPLRQPIHLSQPKTCVPLFYFRFCMTQTCNNNNKKKKKKPAVESRKKSFQLNKAQVQQNMSLYSQAMNTPRYPADCGYHHKESGHLTKGCHYSVIHNQFL